MKRRIGSVAVKKEIPLAPTWANLISAGDPVVLRPGRPNVALLNANNFGYGIANLGVQAIAQFLLRREINVYFAFADTMDSRPFLNDSTMAPSKCDIIALSIPFEDSYLRALKMLEQSGLPIYARDRGDELPLVVAGGQAMINPIPLGEFVDVIVIGEGREALYEIVTRYRRARDAGRSKRDSLFELVDIPGVYIPSHYRIEVDDRGYVAEFECFNGKPCVESNPPLDMKRYPIFSVWTSKFACYDHEDYFSLMAAMGCDNKCPYCVVGHIQGLRSGRAVVMEEEDIVRLAIERRERYGTNLVKVFFSSAFSCGNVASSSALKSLLARMHRHRFSCRVGSLNIKQADEELFALLKVMGQESVTFAPETTEDLRPQLGKAYISDEKLLKLAAYAKKHDLAMNIYSLGGIPGETDGVTRHYAALLRSLRRTLGNENPLFVHYNPVFMKAQTPYQYFGNLRPAEVRRRYALLRSELQGQDIHFVSVIPDSLTFYQPVLALGDFNSGRVLAYLYRLPQVTEEDWRQAFKDLGFDDARYFTTKDPNQTLPWEHIVYTNHQRLKRRASAIQRSNGIEVYSYGLSPVSYSLRTEKREHPSVQSKEAVCSQKPDSFLPKSRPLATPTK